MKALLMIVIVLLPVFCYAAPEVTLMSSWVADQLFQSPEWSIPIIQLGHPVHIHFLVFVTETVETNIICKITRNGILIERYVFETILPSINPWYPEADGIVYITPAKEQGFITVKPGNYRSCIFIRDKSNHLLLKKCHKFWIE